ncbi:hypothetical protein CPn_0212 [Chlamydia pneumoniae CWL029]|uniref:Uncharacterized protein n=1 Tax=Chlamydia pneumoniae TaxID=83558 RepID=Q9Z8X2_CHLPN|nr:hypothetical protein CPn_0212 [Chlamydia pneumoniae CWL029]AAF38374.1 hypothetical protein CP_0553 [Chlamydia pneumoniae AR39]BAA98422.1 hypothetical protein [Chlamydia pneumoniae J138]
MVVSIYSEILSFSELTSCKHSLFPFGPIETASIRIHHVFNVVIVCLIILGTLFVCLGMVFLGVFSTYLLGMSSMILGLLLISIGLALLKFKERYGLEPKELFGVEGGFDKKLPSEIIQMQDQIADLARELDLEQKKDTLIRGFSARLDVLEGSKTEKKQILKIGVPRNLSEIQERAQEQNSILEQCKEALLFRRKSAQEIFKKLYDRKAAFWRSYREDLWCYSEIHVSKKALSNLYIGDVFEGTAPHFLMEAYAMCRTAKNLRNYVKVCVEDMRVNEEKKRAKQLSVSELLCCCTEIETDLENETNLFTSDSEDVLEEYQIHCIRVTMLHALWAIYNDEVVSRKPIDTLDRVRARMAVEDCIETFEELQMCVVHTKTLELEIAQLYVDILLEA